MAKIEALAYVVAQSTDVSKWRLYGEQVLGMAAVDGPDGSLLLKMDERSFRYMIVPGADDRYLVSGWEVADAHAFEVAVNALEAAGVDVELGNSDLTRARQVSALVSFEDPSGNRHELTVGPTGPTGAFVSPIGVSGFVTGAGGMGHTVLPSLNFDASLELFTEVLGFGLSDRFHFKPAPDAPEIRLYFLHCNPRHHSLALAEMPNPSGCVHVMAEVNSMTEVGKAHDRMMAHGVKLTATLGEHENDHMTSFYMLTPSGFALEYGYGGLTVDPSSFQPTQSERVSVWGHDFSVGFE